MAKVDSQCDETGSGCNRLPECNSILDPWERRGMSSGRKTARSQKISFGASHANRPQVRPFCRWAHQQCATRLADCQ